MHVRLAEVIAIINTSLPFLLVYVIRRNLVLEVLSASLCTPLLCIALIRLRGILITVLIIDSLSEPALLSILPPVFAFLVSTSSIPLL